MLADAAPLGFLGIEWSPVKCCLIGGPLLMLLGFCVGAVLVWHTKAPMRRLTGREASRVAFNATGRPLQNIHGPAVGAGVEITANIDTLRKAARRGDWLTFLGWPVMLFCWCFGMWGLFLGLSVHAREGWLAVLSGVFMLPMSLGGCFMAWAALYTNIDLDADADVARGADSALDGER